MNFANSENKAGTSNTDETIKEDSQLLRCFVCDAKVRGRFYYLAKCKTQISKTRVIKKLGELVGDRYMVVISEDDVICRTCAILINTLDRLETEMHNVRDQILLFLERKYSLEDGELRGDSDRPKPSQPPQITKSSTKGTSDHCGKQNEMDVEAEGKMNNNSEDNKIQKNPHSFLQCDKCKYTTHLNSFMMYHLRDHAKEKIICDMCGSCIPEIQQDTRHNCMRTYDLGDKENKKDNSDSITKNDSLKTLPMDKVLQPTVPFSQAISLPLMSSSSHDHLYTSNILLTNNPTSLNQSISIVQPINVDISRNTIKNSKSNPIQQTEVTTKNIKTRQILTLTDDGTVKLVEVPCEET